MSPLRWRFIIGRGLLGFVTTGLAPVERCLETRTCALDKFFPDLQAARGGLQIGEAEVEEIPALSGFQTCFRWGQPRRRLTPA